MSHEGDIGWAYTVRAAPWNKAGLCGEYLAKSVQPYTDVKEPLRNDLTFTAA